MTAGLLVLFIMSTRYCEWFVLQSELKELHKHNIESKDFEALPADIKHEILTELKDAGRKTDWACINSMPKVFPR